MENGHTNISYSAYKDYENLTTNDFSDWAQKIWDLVKKNFHCTKNIAYEKELCEYTKIFISHHAYKEENPKRGGHFYSTYQIVHPGNNLQNDRDRKFKKYVDPALRIIIFDSYSNKYGEIAPITEDTVKEANRKENLYLGLDDGLADRNDKWMRKYAQWIGKH